MVLEKPTIFLLGGGGFMGRHLHNYFVERDYRVVNVGPQSKPLITNASVTVIDEKITDYTILKDHISSSNVFYYLVNNSSPVQLYNSPTLDISNNIVGLVNFCQSMVDVPNAKVIFTSSGGTVYGNPYQIPTPEQAVTKPISLYGVTKLVSEQYLQLFAKQFNFKYVVARISNPYGPAQIFNRNQGLIPAILKNIVTSNPISIVGDGHSIRDYIFIDDVIEALAYCGMRHVLSDQIVNIGSGNGHSVMEVIWEVSQHVKAEISTISLPKRVGDVQTNILDISKFNSLVGWTPKVSFKTGVKLTVEAYLKKNNHESLLSKT